jgi:hypothetical protein
MRKIFTTALTLAFCAAAHAQPSALDDTSLSQVSGRDGVSFAMHLALNDPAQPGAIDNRLSIGFHVDGNDTYLVVNKLHGLIDMFDANLSVQKKPDGSDYLALSLPATLKFTDFGFDSLGAQADPLAPVTESLGRMNLNGTLSMQGQFRFWAH